MTKTIAFSLVVAASIGLAACTPAAEENNAVNVAADDALNAADNTMSAASNDVGNLANAAGNVASNAM